MQETPREHRSPDAGPDLGTAEANDVREEKLGLEPHDAKTTDVTSQKSEVTPSKTNLWILPIPSRVRYDPAAPPTTLSIPLNVLFGIAATFTVANLYYSQPILVQLAEAFGPDVTYNQVSVVTTLVQAGYAAGILLISPLGDMVSAVAGCH